MSNIFHWGQYFPLSFLCVFLYQIVFSCLALRESKVFYLRKVISSQLALALLRLWTVTDANLMTRSMLCRLHRVTVHISGWEMVTDAFPEAKLHGIEDSVFIHKLHSSSLPPPLQQVMFFILFASPTWILNTSQGAGFQFQCWAAFLLLWCHCFRLFPTPALRYLASHGSDTGKALFLQVQKGYQSLSCFNKALSEGAGWSKSVQLCHLRSWEVVR